MSNPTAYPLAWPPGKPRTPYSARKVGRFSRKESEWRPGYNGGADYSITRTKSVTLSGAVDRVLGEIRRMGGARGLVISTNVALRQDGLPRSGQRAPDDPGVAIYFRLDGDPVALACDRYLTVEDNMAAIAAHLDASRAIERHGVGTLREIFRGFMALPSAINVDDWREELGNPNTVAQAEVVYYERMKTAHPDVGGSEAEAAKLNAAIARAREVLA
jgi:hypothetical protein